MKTENEMKHIHENGNGGLWCDGVRHYMAPQGRRHERNDDGPCYHSADCMKAPKVEAKHTPTPWVTDEEAI